MGGLTQAQAIAYVAQGLAMRGTDLDTKITTMFDLVQFDELEKGVELPWFLILEDQTLTGTLNVPTLTIPTDFIRMVNDGGIYVSTTDGLRRYLRKRPIDQLIGIQQDETDGTLPAGDPFYYALLSTTIYVSPVPETAWTAKINYYAHATTFSTLAAGGQNVWLANAPGVLCNLVGSRMAQDIELDQAERKFQSRFAAAQVRLDAEIAMRETSDNEFSMGNQA